MIFKWFGDLYKKKFWTKVQLDNLRPFWYIGAMSGGEVVLMYELPEEIKDWLGTHQYLWDMRSFYFRSPIVAVQFKLVFG